MRFIADGTSCFILFPGRAYSHYEAMRDGEVVFMDFPGLPLDDVKSVFAIANWELRIAVSDKIRKWHIDGQNSELPPPRSIYDLIKVRSTARRRLLAGLLRGFLSDINKGDIVIVPSSEQEGIVLFGEVLDEAGTISAHKHPILAGELVPARKIRWVAKTKRADIPRWLDVKLPRPNPLRQVKKNFYPGIFDLAYERYHYLDEYVCKFFVTSNRFTGLENLEIQQLLLLSTALRAAENNPAADSIFQIIRKNAASFVPLEQRIDINSPGHIVLISKTAAPFVAALLVAFACQSRDLEVKPPRVRVVNSQKSLQSDAEQRCLTDMEKEIERDLELMNQKQWQEACEMAISANKNNGLKSGVRWRTFDRI